MGRGPWACIYPHLLPVAWDTREAQGHGKGLSEAHIGSSWGQWSSGDQADEALTLEAGADWSRGVRAHISPFRTSLSLLTVSLASDTPMELQGSGEASGMH